MKRFTHNTVVKLLCAAAATASLAACDRQDPDRTAGQKLDGAVAQMERKADEVKADARAAGQEVRQGAGTAVDAIADKTKDAAITTSINAELAKDSQLSALRVDVDTVNGNVTLRGTAPDPASRDRATAMAKSVDGVKAVDNQLNVNSKG